MGFYATSIAQLRGSIVNVTGLVERITPLESSKGIIIILRLQDGLVPLQIKPDGFPQIRWRTVKVEDPIYLYEFNWSRYSRELSPHPDSGVVVFVENTVVISCPSLLALDGDLEFLKHALSQSSSFRSNNSEILTNEDTPERIFELRSRKREIMSPLEEFRCSNTKNTNLDSNEEEDSNKEENLERTLVGDVQVSGAVYRLVVAIKSKPLTEKPTMTHYYASDESNKIVYLSFLHKDRTKYPGDDRLATSLVPGNIVELHCQSWKSFNPNADVAAKVSILQSSQMRILQGFERANYELRFKESKSCRQEEGAYSQKPHSPNKGIKVSINGHSFFYTLLSLLDDEPARREKINVVGLIGVVSPSLTDFMLVMNDRQIPVRFSSGFITLVSDTELNGIRQTSSPRVVLFDVTFNRERGELDFNNSSTLLDLDNESIYGPKKLDDLDLNFGLLGSNCQSIPNQYPTISQIRETCLRHSLQNRTRYFTFLLAKVHQFTVCSRCSKTKVVDSTGELDITLYGDLKFSVGDDLLLFLRLKVSSDQQVSATIGENEQEHITALNGKLKQLFELDYIIHDISIFEPWLDISVQVSHSAKRHITRNLMQESAAGYAEEAAGAVEAAAGYAEEALPSSADEFSLPAEAGFDSSNNVLSSD